MNRAPSAALIAGITLLVALLDFSTSAEFVGSILFALPLALCAMQDSKRLLWRLATVAAFLTFAGEFWGFHRAALSHLWVGLANRALVVASLFTLAAFIHFWIENNRKIALDDDARKLVEARFLESEERFRILVERVQNYAIFTLDPHGKIVSWNAGAERIKGYKADEIVGQNFSRFYLADDIDQGKPQAELQMAADPLDAVFLEERHDVFEPVVNRAITEQFAVFLPGLAKERYEVEQIAPLQLFKICLGARFTELGQGNAVGGECPGSF